MDSSRDGDIKNIVPVKEEYDDTSIVIKVETVVDEVKGEDMQTSKVMSDSLSGDTIETIPDGDRSSSCRKEAAWLNIHPTSMNSYVSLEDNAEFIDVSPIECDAETIGTREIMHQPIDAPCVDSKVHNSTASGLASKALSTTLESKVTLKEEEKQESNPQSGIFTLCESSTQKANACVLCHKLFDDSHDHKEHMRMHTEEGIREDKEYFKVSTKAVTTRRQVGLHTGEGPCECTICSKTFARAEDLRLHMMAHTWPYACGVCNKAFTMVGKLRGHLKIHAAKGPYLCDLCNKTFPCKENFKRHVPRHSGKTTPYMCTICDQKFANVRDHKRHTNTHSVGKSYVCDICNRAFAQKWHLESHIHRHLDRKPFKCNLCDKAFAREGGLKTHVKSHTGKAPIVCDICNKTFSLAVNLKDHQRRCMCKN